MIADIISKYRNNAFLPLQAIVAAPLLAILFLPAYAPACNYGKYGLKLGDGSQATVDGLFRGRYNEQLNWRANPEWTEAALIDQDAATDIPGNLDYAWSLFMSGKRQESYAIYQQLMKDDPNHYEVLCSFATVLHLDRRYAEATSTLEKAIGLKPGFRNRAEELHLNMIRHEMRLQTNTQYGRDNMFIPELTSLWNNRKPPEENFSTVDFPPGITSKGIAELLRQFPRYGDGWLALGMLLEHEKDFSMAVKAYDRALEHGTPHKQSLDGYMARFREFGRAHDPGRLVGRGIARTAIVIGVILALLFIYRIVARVVLDVTSHRGMKEEQKRRERRKNHSGPLK